MRQTTIDFDIKRLTPSFLENPFSIYRALRGHDPVHWMLDGSYFLRHYDDLLRCRVSANDWPMKRSNQTRTNVIGCDANRQTFRSFPESMHRS